MKIMTEALCGAIIVISSYLVMGWIEANLFLDFSDVTALSQSFFVPMVFAVLILVGQIIEKEFSPFLLISVISILLLTVVSFYYHAFDRTSFLISAAQIVLAIILAFLAFGRIVRRFI